MPNFRIEFGLDKDTAALARRALDVLERAQEEHRHMDDILSALEKEVANNTTVEGSTETLINNLAALATQAAPNNARLKAVMDTLTANDGRLAALVLANTGLISPSDIPPPAPPVAAPAA